MENEVNELIKLIDKGIELEDELNNTINNIRTNYRNCDIKFIFKRLGDNPDKYSLIESYMNFLSFKDNKNYNYNKLDKDILSDLTEKLTVYAITIQDKKVIELFNNFILPNGISRIISKVLVLQSVNEYYECYENSLLYFLNICSLKRNKKINISNNTINLIFKYRAINLFKYIIDNKFSDVNNITTNNIYNLFKNLSNETVSTKNKQILDILIKNNYNFEEFIEDNISLAARSDFRDKISKLKKKIND